MVSGMMATLKGIAKADAAKPTPARATPVPPAVQAKLDAAAAAAAAAARQGGAAQQVRQAVASLLVPHTVHNG
jgi:hypothetical protein